MNGQIFNSKNKSFLSLESRSYLSLNCVKDIISFDENEVSLLTEDGALTILGSGLHIKQLSLENGKVEVEGKVDLLEYSDKIQKEKGGFLKRRKTVS